MTSTGTNGAARGQTDQGQTEPAAAAAPATARARLAPAVDAVRALLVDVDDHVTEYRGELTIEVTRDRIVDVCTLLRDHPATRFLLLADLSGTDYPDREDRLAVDYHLYSFDLNERLRLKVRVTVDDPHVPTVTGVWPTANWHEREVYDFFGVRFDGHPNLIRILMPEDWEGYPQRKDYPLGGVDVTYKNDVHITPPDTRRYQGGWTSK